jgi:hypothetical protein
MVYSSDASKNRLESEAGPPNFQNALEWPDKDENRDFRQPCQGLARGEPQSGSPTKVLQRPFTHQDMTRGAVECRSISAARACGI